MHKGRTHEMDDSIRLTTATSPAFEMACYSGKVDIVCRQLQQQGVWEWDVARALQYAKNYIPTAQRPFPATVVVDVGGNVGFFGLMAAAQGHHVYMFEPSVRPRALVSTSWDWAQPGDNPSLSLSLYCPLGPTTAASLFLTCGRGIFRTSTARSCDLACASTPGWATT